MGRPPVRCERSQGTDCARRKRGFGRQVLTATAPARRPWRSWSRRRWSLTHTAFAAARRTPYGEVAPGPGASCKGSALSRSLTSQPPRFGFTAICDRHGKLRAGQCHAPRFVTMITMHKWRFSLGTSLERLLVEPREMVNGTEIKTGSCLVRCCTLQGPSSTKRRYTLANASRRSRQTAPRARQTGAWCCLQRAMPIPSWPEAVRRDLEEDGKFAAKQTNISDLRSL